MALETALQITPKQLEWETLSEKFSRITDELGMPIDPAIREPPFKKFAKRLTG